MTDNKCQFLRHGFLHTQFYYVVSDRWNTNVLKAQYSLRFCNLLIKDMYVPKTFLFSRYQAAYYNHNDHS